MSPVVLLDNEAAQALGEPGHPKHRRVLSHVQAVAQRKRRGTGVTMAIPTAVRVEAGWDRTDPTWAFANRLRIRDEALDPTQANQASAIRRRTGVSVADAHLGAVIQATAEPVTVLPNDPDDIRAAAGDQPTTIVTI